MVSLSLRNATNAANNIVIFVRIPHVLIVVYFIFSIPGQLSELHQSAGENGGRPFTRLRYELVQTSLSGIHYRGKVYLLWKNVQ